MSRSQLRSHTLTCFPFFSRIFEEKRDCSQSSTEMLLNKSFFLIYSLKDTIVCKR